MMLCVGDWFFWIGILLIFVEIFIYSGSGYGFGSILGEWDCFTIAKDKLAGSRV